MLTIKKISIGFFDNLNTISILVYYSQNTFDYEKGIFLCSRHCFIGMYVFL